MHNLKETPASLFASIILYPVEIPVISSELHSGIGLVIVRATHSAMIRRRCSIKYKTQNVIGYIVVITGVLLLLGGLCILVISVLLR